MHTLIFAVANYSSISESILTLSMGVMQVACIVLYKS